ncbi:hypothetical protein [Aliivibrio fischeri]|uniref:hypothetical protein n=1 Tax=Aliivibrio fischeri TaxID=668 RepID=UPI0007C4BA41|nr:hypothetical protein [Aliivibrio fischeri]
MTTHINSIDFRSTPLRIVCTMNTNAVMKLMSFSKTEFMDALTAFDYIEVMYGSVLVACQTYAVGTVSDVNKIRKCSGQAKLKKINLYRNVPYKPCEYTEVEFINALANYFKHSTEWDIWPINETTKTLRAYGINENTEFPLRFGVESLLNDSEDLRGLCTILEGWRFHQIRDWCK